VKLSNSIRDVLYPGAFLVAIGSIWTLGWATSAAAKTDSTCGPVVSREDSSAANESRPTPVEKTGLPFDVSEDDDGASD
jgi:hypothetical protein